MRVLWLCNMMLPVIARQFDLEASNKEGWLSGLLEVLYQKKKENNLEIAVAFPAPEGFFTDKSLSRKREMLYQGSTLTCYGFREDTNHPENYDACLEEQMKSILKDFSPDIVHGFGTEFPHTLAMCRVFPRKDRILLGIQGLCSVHAGAYFANLPKSVIDKVTFRDRLKQDSLQDQYNKFVKRGEMEVEALNLTGNIAGRTEWDQYYTKMANPSACYYVLNETLRGTFYEGKWDANTCQRHRIFLSQGDYPLKGLHYMLKAMPKILERYPDAQLVVAGNNLTAYHNLKEKLKISGYGQYLRGLIKDKHLEKRVSFVGKQDAEQMKRQYLLCHTFVCCSANENSPNSLGEAMMLGVPCIATDVGGIPSIFRGDIDGIMVEGYRTREGEFKRNGNSEKTDEEQLECIADSLASAVIRLWEKEELVPGYCENARKHAMENHDRNKNYRQLLEVYSRIAGV